MVVQRLACWRAARTLLEAKMDMVCGSAEVRKCDSAEVNSRKSIRNTNILRKQENKQLYEIVCGLCLDYLCYAMQLSLCDYARMLQIYSHDCRMQNSRSRARAPCMMTYLAHMGMMGNETTIQLYYGNMVYGAFKTTVFETHIVSCHGMDMCLPSCEC